MPDEAPRVLSLLSHELRGPLGVVRGYLRLLEQSSPELSERSREAIVAALRASDRLADVLDEASVYAHLQIGDLRLDLRETRLAELLGGLDTSSLPAGTRMSVAPAAAERYLKADPIRLGKAIETFLTLVTRAQPGGPDLELSATETKLAETPAVRLRLARKGLPEAECTEAGVDLARGGFGLSIPIAARVVQAHRGDVRELRHGERVAGVLIRLPIIT